MVLAIGGNGDYNNDTVIITSKGGDYSNGMGTIPYSSKYPWSINFVI